MSSPCKHVAIIMDGNGRWAQRQDQKRTQGHQVGVEVVRSIAIEATQLGIEVLTLYAFSTENWLRPRTEVEFLMKLPAYFFDRYMADIMKYNIRVEILGLSGRIPDSTQKVLDRAVKNSSKNTGMVLAIAMDYGSRAEMVEAIKTYTQQVMDQERDNDLTVDQFGGYLQTANYPEIDLLIRTSGEERLSNFLLWQMAYAELMFVDKAWPEFTGADLKACLDEFSRRQRRFGGLNP